MIEYEKEELVKIVKENKEPLEQFFSFDKTQELIEKEDYDGLYMYMNDILSPQGIRYSALTATLILSDIDFLSKMTVVRSDSFWGLSVSKIVLPENITYIGYGAFEYCVELTDLTIPSKIKTVKWSALGGCENLYTLTFNGTRNEFYDKFDREFDEILNQTYLEEIVCKDGKINLNRWGDQ